MVGFCYRKSSSSHLLTLSLPSTAGAFSSAILHPALSGAQRKGGELTDKQCISDFGRSRPWKSLSDEMTNSSKPDASANDGKKPDENRSDRGAQGKFVAGNRANPGGRPRGRRNKATELIAELLAGEAESLTRALIRRAKDGNAHRPRPHLRPAGTCPQGPADPNRSAKRSARSPISRAAEDVILDRLASGAITPSEAQVLSSLVNNKRQLLESLDMEARVAALESRLALETTEAQQR